MPYQLDPAKLALQRPRQRILIADTVGLGKTLEAGILMSELIARGKGKRILVVTVKSMMTQFQKEMWNRFTIPLVRLDSNRIQKIRANLPSNYNPFFYYDKTIVSIDTLKRDVEYRTHLENAYWDIIVIDEAQNVAERGDHQAQRSRLAKLLADRSDTMIMLSATPHDGRAKSFASLMNMLDPTAIADPQNYTPEDIKGLCIRRFKKDVKDQVSGSFLERKITLERCNASAKEEYAFDIFAEMQLEMDLGKTKGTGQLFKTSLEKSLFSSPAACIKSIEARLKKLYKKYTADDIKDIHLLENLKTALEAITPADFTRYQKLLDLIRSKEYAWNPADSGDRVVIFTERIETMKYLAERLRKDLGLKANAIQEISGGMSDAEQQRISTPEKVALFALAKDDDLLRLGVPEVQLDLVRSFVNKEDFYKSESAMPHDVYEHLSWLVEGFPMEEVLELVSEEQNSSAFSEDLAAALDVPTTLKSFVVVDGEDELRRIMAEPLEKWRVFLHPTQRKIVQKEYSGSARVLGGAGTGKTVVAMHRAKHLASKCEGQQRILMTTFTANLAADIRENLRKICTLEELRRIEVIHLDAWVNQFLRESGFSAQIGYDDVINPLWERAVLLANIDLPYETTFYEEEWNRIVIAQEALTLEKYVKATRNGRGTRLDRKKRMQVWKVFENYQNLMKENQIRDINTAMYESTKLLQSAGRKPRYASIIIDEGQDFSDNAYRLIRALAGEEHPNDIFIVGDSHQRIYRNYPTLSKCGINVRGRSSILKINYRTTEEIRKHAFALLNGISFDDLDEDLDLGDKCQSLTHGEKPIVENFENANDEFDFLLREVKKLKENGVSLTDICVVARTKKLVDDYIALFTRAGIRSYAIKRNKVDDRSFDGLRVATMHRVKGLEFKYVFIAAVNNRIIPLPFAINKTDAVSEVESITSEKCLLYVAMTRAQKGVYITSYGRPSEFLV